MAYVKPTTYRGFSTSANAISRGKTFGIADVEAVKQDLINHIYTIPGERVMLPNFGTRIPLLAFEPLDEGTLEVIRADLKMVFDYDPRVQTREITVIPLSDNNTIVAMADLYYVEFNVTDTLHLEFAVGK